MRKGIKKAAQQSIAMGLALALTMLSVTGCGSPETSSPTDQADATDTSGENKVVVGLDRKSVV